MTVYVLQNAVKISLWKLENKSKKKKQNSPEEEEETYSNHSQGPFPLLNSTKASKNSDQENNSPKANEDVGRGRDGCVMTVDGYQFLDVYRVRVYFKPNPCAEYATTGKLKIGI